MKQFSCLRAVQGALVLAAVLFCMLTAHAQQTLGSINGTVLDPSGAAVSGASITVTNTATNLTETTTSQRTGSFQIFNLPIGAYTVKIGHEGFENTELKAITVREARATTVNASLTVGKTTESVEVVANPLLNATDASNGYTLDQAQIQETPLATGSFTQLAVLAPGVSAQLLSGIGTNAGLGNQAIWANGQRDTSNSFQVNGVDVTNLFNGKSASQDASQRYAFNIGQGSSLGGQAQTNTSVYGSNGNGLATPPPEMIQEMSVQTSMYDAQSGTNSGLHIQLSTTAGTNKYHGKLYATHATNFINAAPFFFKQDAVGNPNGNVPLSEVNPQLHKELFGATAGGPIFRDKLFFFAGYQYMHDSDQFKGFSTPTVPLGLTNDRSTTGIQAAATSYNVGTYCYANTGSGKTYADYPTCFAAQQGLAANQYTGTVDPVAAAILSAKLPNGQYLIPSVQNTSPTAIYSGSGNVFLPGASLFKTQMAVGNLDYDFSRRDRLSAKYFYQSAPNLSPYTIANTGGFPELEDSGAQVGSLSNAVTIGSHISWQQLVGFSRQKVYSGFESQVSNANIGIGFPSGNFPGLGLSDLAYSKGGSITTGPDSAFLDAGYFQNRLNPSTNFIYTFHKHTISAGGSYNYTQLNVRNNRGGFGVATTSSMLNLLSSTVKSSSYLVGNANRYYRTNEIGSYVQDKWQVLPNLSITAGLRYDYNGPFTEKFGNMFNFEPTLYSATASTVSNSGFIVAGNNKLNPTSGVSNSTLTGRQWGIGPRLGVAFSPTQDHGKVVFRGGFGFYYDRGELFSYLSQPAGGSTGGPFGVTEAAPLVDYVTGSGTKTLENPLGSTVVPTPTSNPAYFTTELSQVTQNLIRSTCTAIINQQDDGCGVVPINFGAYNRANKLPYSINFSFDMQWQPTNTTAFTIGYVGNLDRHGVIPIPFNEPGIATPTNPINGETSSYGYQVLNQASPVKVGSKTYYNSISTEPNNTYDGGNIDLRVPYVGYSDNAALFTAAGNGSYNALQTQLIKRLSHHVQATVSYTWSHALDEQSDIGLFFTGDNPNRLRDSYASADFDQTHTLTSAFLFTLPDTMPKSSLLGKIVDDWQLTGIVVGESGEPFSLYEYNGAVGSIYFGNYPTLANPVLGIKNGSNPKSALTGHVGAFQTATGGYIGAIDVTQLQVNSLQPGQKGIPAATSLNEPSDIFENDFTPGQRNIFRQAFQKRADISVNKAITIKERYQALYSISFYNLTNTPSFDVPNNSADVSQSYVGSTAAYGQVLSGPTTANQQAALNSLYVYPVANADGSTKSTFGAVRNTVGGSRAIEMSLHLTF
jgi:hypothetical protein